MKLILMWAVSVSWFLLLAWLAVDAFTSEAPMLATNWLRRFQGLLAGVGALTVGLLPVIGSATVHHLHRRRERHRLVKQKAKIEKRLARIEQRDTPRSPRALPGSPEPHAASISSDPS